MNKVLSKLIHPQKRIAGLDIGLSSVKMMEIAGETLENATLLNYAIEPIPEFLIGNESRPAEELEDNINALAEVVRKCWKKAGITTKHVAIALPSSVIFPKIAVVPIFEEEDELKIHLQQALIQYLPSGTSFNEIILDYYILGINEQSPTEYDMLLIMAKKEKVEDRIAIVEAAGLIPVILDVEQYAVQNILRLMKGDDFLEKTYLVLDSSATTLRMVIYRKGEIIFTRDSQIGGLTLTKEIITNLGLTYADAEKIKVENDSNENYEMVKKSFLNNYISEFMTSLQYFISSNTDANVDEIILTGGTLGLPEVEEAFKKIIREHNETYVYPEPYIARPLHNTPKDDQIRLNIFLKDEPSLFLVTALALRPFLRQF